MQISNDWQPEPKTRLNLVKNRRYLGMAKVSVVGAGSWGTALAMLLCNNGHDTMLWSHREEQAEELRTARENKAKLPGVKIPEEIHVTSDLSDLQKHFDIPQQLYLLLFRLLFLLQKHLYEKNLAFSQPSEHILHM